MLVRILHRNCVPLSYVTNLMYRIRHISGGEVVDLMNKRIDNRMTETEILAIFADVCEVRPQTCCKRTPTNILVTNIVKAILWMHSCNPVIIHRDLKVENVLVSHDGVYKLCDYGSATTVDSVDSIISEGRIEALEDDINKQTTLQYRAPELIDVSRNRPISEKIDIWVCIQYHCFPLVV